MRTIDQTKKEAITEAVYDLALSDGLVNLSMSKVAKAAGVSPATIYIYYTDKEDMLSSMYVAVKGLLDSNLQEKIDQFSTPKDRLTAMVTALVESWKQYPRQANFMRAINSNKDLISESAIQEAHKRAAAIMNLYQELKDNGSLKSMSDEGLSAMLFGPINILLDDALNNGAPIEDNVVEQVIASSVASVLI
jgi:AcrR family transcriptional regulator